MKKNNRNGAVDAAPFSITRNKISPTAIDGEELQITGGEYIFPASLKRRVVGFLQKP